jgi:hypothetical protein
MSIRGIQRILGLLPMVFSLTLLPPVGVFIVPMLSMMATGPGEVANDCTTLGAPAKWTCVLAMLLGRLEIFTL